MKTLGLDPALRYTSVVGWIGWVALACRVVGAVGQPPPSSPAVGATTAPSQARRAGTSRDAGLGIQRVGNVGSWTRLSSGLQLHCGDRQKVRIDILTEGLFRVRFSVAETFPASRLIAEWHLVKSNEEFPGAPFQLREEDRQLWLTTTQLRLKLEKAPLRLSVFDRDHRLLTRESAQPGMGAGRAASVHMERAPDEHFFGLGEGLGTFDPKAGFAAKTILDVPLHGTQLEGGVITLDQTGKKSFFCLGPNWAGFKMTPVVIPFFMSTKGYGVYLNNFRDSLFDLGNTASNAWSITLGGPPNQVPHAGTLDYYFLYGPSFHRILGAYTDLTGKTPMVPKWSLGYFQICDFNQTQAEVLRIARDFRQRDFPCDILLLEPGWMKTPYRMDGWSPDRFPDPDALIAELAKLNFRLGLWQCGPADWVFTSWDRLTRKANQWGADITNPDIHWSLLGPWCPGALSPIPQGDLCQFYLKLRYQLIPYIYSTHRQAHTAGIPYLRAMVLDYQDDPTTYSLDRQCLLGDWFLLAAYTKDVYLPAGRWVDYWSSEAFDSKGEWKRNCLWPATAGGPLFVKGGAIIPMGPVPAWVDQEPLEIVHLDVYPHGESQYVLYEDDGTTCEYESGAYATTEFRCRQEPDDLVVTLGNRRGAYQNMPRRRSYLKRPVRMLGSKRPGHPLFGCMGASQHCLRVFSDSVGRASSRAFKPGTKARSNRQRRHSGSVERWPQRVGKWQVEVAPGWPLAALPVGWRLTG